MDIAGRFEIIEKLGEGGMGEVHMALDLLTGEIVAVKIANIFQSKDPVAMRERFLREIEILSKLHNPHIVKFISSGQTDEILYYAMEFIPGQPISRIGDYLQSARQIMHVVSALEDIHKYGIIHRDLKPSNIIVSEGAAKLLDFGIAHINDADSAMLTKAGTFIGTAEYMSPEQLMCSGLDERSDIYSLGAVLYEILTGKPPFVADDVVTLIYKIIQERPTNPSEIDSTVPPMLENICLKMLEKRPERRYQSDRELMTDLSAFVEGLSPSQKLSFNYISKEAPYIGRKEIFDRFNDILSSSVSGNGQSLEIIGGNGFGKTRTVAELQSVSLSRYVRFIACDGNVCQPGYPAISTLLDSLADYEINIDIDFVMAHAQLIRSVSPRLADKLNLPEDALSQNEENQASSIIADILLRAFKEVPVVYAFDGGIDKFTYSVVENLVKSSGDFKSIIVSTSSQKHPFNFDFSFELGPFNNDELSLLAERVLGRKITFEELTSLTGRTSGNPQFAFELIRESRNLRKTITVTSLPQSLAELMSSKLESITGLGNARKLLNKMALLNHPVSIEELKSIAGMEYESFRKSIQVLFDEGMIVERSTGSDFVVEMSSGALMEVVAQTISNEETQRLHVEIASELEKVDPVKFCFVIGIHYLKAMMIDEGVGYVTKAFAMADELQQYKKSDYYTSEVLPFVELVNDSLVRNLCYYYCVRSFTQNGKLTEAGELLERYRKSVWAMKSSQQEKLDFYTCELAMLLGSKNYEKQIKTALEAMKLINNTTSMKSRSMINYYLGSGYIHLAQAEKGIPFVQKSIEQSTGINERFLGKNILAIGYSKLNKLEQAIEYLEMVRKEARERNLINHELVAMFNMSSFYANLGKPQVAKELVSSVLDKAISHHYDILTANSYMKAIVINNTMNKIKENKTLIDDCIDFFDRKGLKTNIVQIYQQGAILSFLEKDTDRFEQHLAKLKLEAIALKLRSYVVVYSILKCDEIIERQSWQELMDFVANSETELHNLMPNQTKDDLLVLKYSSFAVAYANMGMVEKSKNQLRLAQQIFDKEKRESDLTWVEMIYQMARCEVGIFDSVQGQTIRGSFFSRSIDENPKRLIPETWEKVFVQIEEMRKSIGRTPLVEFYYKPRITMILARHIQNKLRLEPNSPDRSELANKAILMLNDVLGYLNDNDLQAYKEDIRQTSRNLTDMMIRKRY